MKLFYTTPLALMLPAALLATSPGDSHPDDATQACAAPAKAAAKKTTVTKTTARAAPKKPKSRPRKVMRRLKVQMNFFSDLPYDQKNEIVMGAPLNTAGLHACVHLDDDTSAQQKALVEECADLQALQVAGRLDLCGLPVPPRPQAIKLLHLGDSSRPLRPSKTHSAAPKRLQPDVLAKLDVFMSLTCLSLDGLCFESSPFKALKPLHQLREFRFSSNLPLDDNTTPPEAFEDLTAFFAQNSALEKVSLFSEVSPYSFVGEPAHHQIIHTLAAIQNLRFLGLGRFRLTEEDLAAVPMQHLEHFCVENVRDLNTIKPLKEARRLRHLHVWSYDLTLEGLQALSTMPRLQQLYLVGLPNGDNVAQLFYDLKELAPEECFLWPNNHFSEEACAILTTALGDNCGPINAEKAIPADLYGDHVCLVSDHRAKFDDKDRSHIPFYTES